LGDKTFTKQPFLTPGGGGFLNPPQRKGFWEGKALSLGGQTFFLNKILGGGALKKPIWGPSGGPFINPGCFGPGFRTLLEGTFFGGTPGGPNNTTGGFSPFLETPQCWGENPFFEKNRP